MRTVLMMILLLPALVLAVDAPAPLADPATALLIIDVQVFYFPEGALPLVEPEAASDNAGRLLDAFREAGRKVVHVGHEVAAGGDFHADVAPRSDELVIMKSEVSAFNGTDLKDRLAESGIERLVICGMQTHMCLEGAVRAAYDLGYDCVVVGDACATRDLVHGETAVAAAAVHGTTLATLDQTYARVVDTDEFLGGSR